MTGRSVSRSRRAACSIRRELICWVNVLPKFSRKKVLKYCGDNGAMIAAQGYYEYQDGNLADWTLNGLPTLPIDYR